MYIKFRNVAEAIFLLALACLVLSVFFLALPESVDSGVWAAWVQAVGSIAAIAGSFTLAHYRAGSEKRAKQQALRAVVESAYSQTQAMAESARRMPRYALVGYWGLMGREEAAALILALENFPLHELSTADQVRAVIGLRGALIMMRDGFLELMDSAPEDAAATVSADRIEAQARLAEHHWGRFERPSAPEEGAFA